MNIIHAQSRVELVKLENFWNVKLFEHRHSDKSRCNEPWNCKRVHARVLRWEEEFPNLVTTEGLNEILTRSFKTIPGDVNWYVGLVDNASFSAYAAADVMNSHAGWIEGVPYSNANRPTWTPGSVSAGSVDNSASKAVFNINATLTVRGCFLTSSNTKSGTTGKLYGEGDFSSSRSVLSGDTLNVQVTLTAA